MDTNEIADSLAHIDFLIDEKIRDKLGITGRELDTQVLRLCGGFNDLQTRIADLEKQLKKYKPPMIDPTKEEI
jgi:hypothetical protein